MTDKFTLREAVELAITTEQLGAHLYARMEKKFADDSKLSEIFAKLAADEKAHEAQFKSLLKQVPEDEPEDQRYELYAFLRATAISEFFSSDSFKDTDEIKDSAEALSRAFAFEKATHQYYQALRDVIGESPQIDDIIKAEKNHVVTLMKVILSDAKFRGVSDKW